MAFSSQAGVLRLEFLVISKKTWAEIGFLLEALASRRESECTVWSLAPLGAGPTSPHMAL